MSGGPALSMAKAGWWVNSRMNIPFFYFSVDFEGCVSFERTGGSSGIPG
jgi:hypothetical protein